MGDVSDHPCCGLFHRLQYQNLRCFRTAGPTAPRRKDAAEDLHLFRGGFTVDSSWGVGTRWETTIDQPP